MCFYLITLETLQVDKLISAANERFRLKFNRQKGICLSGSTSMLRHSSTNRSNLKQLLQTVKREDKFFIQQR